jgi:Der1-like family
MPHILQIITPYNIYFNAWLILQKLELWRLFTNFFFFGSLGAAHFSSAEHLHCNALLFEVCVLLMH